MGTLCVCLFVCVIMHSRVDRVQAICYRANVGPSFVMIGAVANLVIIVMMTPKEQDTFWDPRTKLSQKRDTRSRLALQ